MNAEKQNTALTTINFSEDAEKIMIKVIPIGLALRSNNVPFNFIFSSDLYSWETDDEVMKFTPKIVNGKRHKAEVGRGIPYDLLLGVKEDWFPLKQCIIVQITELEDISGFEDEVK